MVGLLWLVGLGLLIYLLSRGGKSEPHIDSAEIQLMRRNIEWSKFIEGYKTVAKSKPEKELIQRMLADIKAQGLVVTTWSMPETEELQQLEQVQSSSTTATTQASTSEYITTPLPQTPKVELDNVSLLLYFGAFLFVASVGLFIVFGGANGAVRTIAVLAVTGVMYSTGIWLFRSKPKLEQAGIAFSGIGMTIAPLVGFAAYYYLFEQVHGPSVWFATSILCFGLYIHALWTFRRPLVSYILIFTFLSLFESGVSIVSAPIYYFGWAMALVGIILSLASRLKGFWPEVQESSRTSSQVLLPLALLTSLVLVPVHGAGQLGVSLLFAAAFYGLEALNTKDIEQQGNAVAAHVASLLSVVCLSYASGHSWKTVAATVLVVNLVQMLCMLLLPQKGYLWRNFASVVLGASVGGVVLAWTSPVILLAATAMVVPIGLIVWQRQQRLEGYVLATIAWMALPLIFGQVYLAIRLTATPQAVLLFGALLIQLGLYIWHNLSDKSSAWKTIGEQAYIISSVLVLGVAVFAQPWACFLLSVGVVATMILLAELENDTDWAVVAGVMVVTPMLRSVSISSVLITSTLSALILNILLALRYRKEANRWFSTGLWLVLPLSLGSGLLGKWTLTSYGWAYLLVMLALVLSRMIARGSVWVSSNVPLGSYAKNASMSYVFGYWIAAALAMGISLVSDNAQLNATAILSAISVIIYCLGRYIEKRTDILAMLPLFGQAILWSAIRPIGGTDSMTLYLLSSTVLAVASYFVWSSGTGNDVGHSNAVIRDGALLALFVSPAGVLVVPRLLWPMPFGLLVAGMVLYYHVKDTAQSSRELAGGLITTAVLWFMWFAGIRELQAYTHVVVGLLALYAYWRANRDESEQSDQYLMSMLAVATIPLGLQALSGQAGGLYGWWLLLEQITFMLIGMAIKKRVVTLWGLYVAVGAVLYQLRNLGWAALTVLAVFIIGIAVYKLQRHSDKN